MSYPLLTMKVKGFAELMPKITELPKKVAQACERKAVVAGADVVLKAAQQRYLAYGRQITGRTYRNIRKAKLRTKSNQWQMVWGVATNRYGMFIEQGTKPHIVRARRARVLAHETIYGGGNEIGAEYTFYGKKVNHPGFRHPRPFLRPGFYGNIMKVIDVEREVLTRWIESEYRSIRNPVV